MVRYYKTQNDMTYKKILARVRNKEASLCFIKIETTGFDPEVDEICGIRAVKLDAGDNLISGATFAKIIKTKKVISIEASKASGITQPMIDNGCNLKDVLEELNQFLGTNTYICGFNTKRFIYPFLFKAAKTTGVPLAAIGGFDVKTLFKTVILPDVNNSGYTFNDLCSVFNVTANLAGYTKALDALYKRLPKADAAVKDGFVKNATYVENEHGRHIVFTTESGLILLDCDNLYFKDYGKQFDEVDMDSFTEYIMNKTKSASIYEVVQKIKHSA